MINVLKESFSFPPKGGEEITIRIMSRPCKHNIKGTVLAREYKIEPITLNETGHVITLGRNIYMGMIAELKRNNIPVDHNLECLKRIWTISGIDRQGIQTYRITLRTDLI